MENKNLSKNLYLRQFNESNAIAYSKAFVSNASNYNFQLLDNAYRNAGKIYANLKIAVETNKCQSEHCSVELATTKTTRRSSSNFFRFFIIFNGGAKRYRRT